MKSRRQMTLLVIATFDSAPTRGPSIKAGHTVSMSDDIHAALTEIFLLYPVTSASITHKLLARGLKTCFNFKNDLLLTT